MSSYFRFIKKYSPVYLKKCNLKNLSIGFILLSISLTGCGYQLLKSHSKVSIESAGYNGSQYLIAIEPILNHTSNPELDWLVMDFITQELLNWPRLKISAYNDSDYCISGEVLSYISQIPYTYDKHRVPLEYKIKLSMSFLIKKIDNSSVEGYTGKNISEHIIKMPNIQEEEIYQIFSSDLGRSRLVENNALKNALKRMIKRVIDQLIITIYNQQSPPSGSGL